MYCTGRKGTMKIRRNRSSARLKAILAGMLVPAILIVALLALSGSSSADSSPAPMPDPVENGPHTVTKVEYYGGSVMMDAPNINGTATAAFQHPLDGALFYPNGAGPFSLIV